MSQFPIDVDTETVLLDGTWYTRDELSARLRAMLDAGDFNVARPSMALQDLTQTLQGVRTVAFRAPSELAQALQDLAGRLQQSVSAVVREAVTQYITDQTSGPALQPEAPGAAMPLVTPAPLQLTTTISNSDLPPVPETAQVIAGPGALKAAGLDATEPGPTADGAEQRWFKQ